jgi:hypothetical protein
MRAINVALLIVFVSLVLFHARSDALFKKKFLLKKLIKVGLLAKLMKSKTKVIVPLIIPFHVSKFRGLGSLSGAFGGSGGGWSTPINSWSSPADSYPSAPMHQMPSMPHFPMSMPTSITPNSNYGSSGWEFSSQMTAEPMPMPEPQASTDSWSGFNPSSVSGESYGSNVPFGMPIAPTSGMDYNSYATPQGVPSPEFNAGAWSEYMSQQPQQTLDDNSANYAMVSPYQPSADQPQLDSGYGSPTESSLDASTIPSGQSW